MCIRDRTNDEGRILTIPRHNPVNAFTMGGIVRDAGLTIEAVSYTHLRAHETVLDLVCRLLLEKKNTSGHAHQ